ncbi:hypothetical protein ACHAXR_007080 [Thalassiosira sp. AJA248-18]
MGKNKKRPNSGDTKKNSKVPNDSSKLSAKKRDANPLLTAQQSFLKSLAPKIRTHFFSPTHVTPEHRAEIWEAQADLGESLVNKYAWSTPDPRLLKVFKHFGPIVEVGCGANAYWSKWMNSEGGVDVVALDVSLDTGGKITRTEKPKKKQKKSKSSDGGMKTGGLVIRQGNPKTLSENAEIRDSGRTLFLCYPDEEYYEHEDNDEDEDDSPPISMAADCLEHFTGSTVIHVGELYGDTLSLEQAPFGRSSSSEFQQRLSGEYHCILKMKLENNWLHVRDTLSVWKRSKTCCLEYEDDDEEEEEGDVEDAFYKHIPPDEVLPVDLAAPCVAHLLGGADGSSSRKDADAHFSAGPGRAKREGKSDGSREKKKKKEEIIAETEVVAGSAW